MLPQTFAPLRALSLRCRWWRAARVTPPAVGGPNGERAHHMNCEPVTVTQAACCAHPLPPTPHTGGTVQEMVEKGALPKAFDKEGKIG
jgi:hypothetical protein